LNEFGNIDFQQQNMLYALHELEVIGENRVSSEAEKSEKVRMITDLEKNLYLEEICWRQ
jgi:soluble P-type ATPase